VLHVMSNPLFNRIVRILCLTLNLAIFATGNAIAAPPQSTLPPQSAVTAPSERDPLIQLGPGDSINIVVYGQPDMNGTVYISDDGTVPIPLVGPVRISGLSPSGAAGAIETALRDGKYFNDPHITITVAQSRSQRVSVLGEVGSAGRYTIESNASIFDLLALAGGVKPTAATTAYLLRADQDGKTVRYPVSLIDQIDPLKSVPTRNLHGGDTLLVPRADYYFIDGEVRTPNRYDLDTADLTVNEAIVRAGGLTQRGSRRRIQIQHENERKSNSAKLNDVVQPGDKIFVKESIF